MIDPKIGAHVPPADPLAEAEDRGAEIVQIFVSNPQSWKKPVPRADAESLRDSEIDFYVHAPYLLNLASPNNRVRIPSRKMLAQTVEAAALIGAKGVIVHGGSVGADEDVDVGFERWFKALDSFEVTVPVLVENTAGSGNTVMQNLDNYGPLWAAIGDFNMDYQFATGQGNRRLQRRCVPRHLSCVGGRGGSDRSGRADHPVHREHCAGARERLA